jgi:hypothetical protein
MPFTLTPIVSTNPFNANVGWNNSWINIENNQNRSLFAQVVYPVNIAEQLTTITNLLSAILAKP